MLNTVSSHAAGVPRSRAVQDRLGRQQARHHSNGDDRIDGAVYETAPLDNIPAHPLLFV